MAETKIRLGVSACLIGENVRYDGDNKHDRFLTDTLGMFVELVPVCPEHECGLSIPRETMRLVGDPQKPRLVTSQTKIDHTSRMNTWVRKRLVELETSDLCGYIFKSKSPSCGLARVKVYDDEERADLIGVGIWARRLGECFPTLPLEEEGRLHDPKLRENFIERVFLFKRWRELCRERRALGKLVDFHSRHKYQILSHSPKHYRELGRLVAHGKGVPVATLYGEYLELLIAAMSLQATVKKNVNVLQHVMGYFKKQLTAGERQELLELIESYSREQVPLVVPITLLRHYSRKFDQPYLKAQTHLAPHPVELRLRNHV